MNAQHKPTYDEWFKGRCDEGYDIGEEWFNEEIDWALREVMKKAGFFNKWEADLPHKQVLAHNDNREIKWSTANWSVGGYGDHVTFSAYIDPRYVPEGHELRQRYPFAFLADAQEFAFDHMVVPSGSRGMSLTYEWEWNDGVYRYADDEEPFNMGTVYDGMEWGLIRMLMTEQTEQLMEVMQQYIDDACNSVLRTLRADYDYFFSEERYKEEY